MPTASELTINTAATAQEMAEAIFGNGVTVESATYTGADGASGIYSGGIATLGEITQSDTGLILSTGNVADFTNSSGTLDTNTAAGTSTDHTGVGEVDGDTRLDAVSGQATEDGAFLDAEFNPTGDLLTMQFVFTSEEYLEYVNGGVNDAIGVWVNDVYVPLTLADGSDTNVTIDTVNNVSNANLYVDNPADLDTYNTEMDGGTVVLSLTAPVNAGVTNTIRIGIGDGGDSAYDSNLLIMGNSVQSVSIAESDVLLQGASVSQVHDLLSNDTNSNGDALTITHINNQAVNVGDTVTLASGEEITLLADGTVSILTDGDLGVNSFTYSTVDAAGTPATGIASIETTATPPNYIVEGDGGDDVIDENYVGDSENDRIDNTDNQTAGNADSVEAGGGNDYVDAGQGNDTINLGDGQDTVADSAGDDVVFGGEGRDTFNYATITGNDTITGGELNDTAPTNSGDIIDAHDNTDDLTVVFTGNEVGSVTDGTDTVTFSEIEHVQTGLGQDNIDASATTVGQIIDGGENADTLQGGSGNDTIAMGQTQDYSATDGDDDLLILEDGFGDDIIEGFETPTDLGGGSFDGRDQLDVTGLTDGFGNPVDTSDVIVSDTNGDGTGDAILNFPGGESITLLGVSPAAVTSDAQLVAMGIPPAPNYIVEGDATDNLIDGSYSDDPQGDLVDSNDAIDGSNDDSIVAGAGNDTIIAGAGNDIAQGDAGDDLMQGGAGSDTLQGGDGNDTLDGGTGGDSLQGGADEDTIVLDDGFAGNDTIEGGETATTGTDFDTLDLSGTTTGVTVDLTGVEAGTVSDGVNTQSFTEIEDVILGAGRDTVALADGSGDDSLQAFDMTDSGDGSTNDQLDVSALTSDGGTTPVTTADVVVSDTNGDGTGDAILTFPGGETVTLVGVTPDQVDSPAELESIGIPAAPVAPNYIVEGDATGNLINGFYAGDPEGDMIDAGDNLAGNDNDSVQAGGGDDTVFAGAGDDSVDGGSGNDSLEGQGGDDTLIGNTGDDTLKAGTGDDSMLGGSGDDTFTLEDTFGADTIVGGETGETAGDTLDLGSVFADTTVDLTGADPEAGSVTSGASTATFTEIENIVLGGGRDTITLADGSGDDTVQAFEMGDSGDGTTKDQLDVSGLTSDGGTTPVHTADVVVSDTNGDGTGDAILTFPGGESITLVGVSPAQVDTADELEAIGIPTQPNFIVEGTEAGEVINAAYGGDPEGDRIDNLDHSDGSNADSVQAGGGNDTIDSGDGDDTVDAGAGDDIVYAQGGNDSVMGGDGNDSLFGETGNDTLEGDAGADSLDGADGEDSLVGGAGSDTLWGQAGNDTLDGGTEDDFINAGFGDDLVQGGAGDDTLEGWFGNDTIEGGAGNDYIDADNDSDFVDAGDGDDTVVGGFSIDTDTIFGGAGNDSLDGQAGDDLIYGGTGNDEQFGSEGDDTFFLEDDFGADTITGGEFDEVNGDTLDLSNVTENTTIDLTDSDPEAGSVSNGTDTATFTEIENIVLGGGADTITLADGSGDDAVEGFDLTDSGDGTTVDQLDVSGLTSDGGTTPVTTDDVVVSDTNGDGTGDAILTFPGGESITLIGVAPTDVDTPAELQSIGIPAAVASNDNIVTGTASGEDIDIGYTDADGTQVDGGDALGTHGETIGSNDDSITAGGGDDTVNAGVGNDTVDGGTGDDVLLGNSGDDSMSGGAGDDRFQGDTGNDTLEGGADADRFEQWRGDGNDTVVGGETGNDVDTLWTIDSTAGVDVTFTGDEAGTSTHTDGTGTTFSEIEQIFGSSQNDTVDGSASNASMTVIGNEGDDEITGGGGDDSLQGDDGADTIVGGAGNDTVVGGDGNDNVSGGVGNDTVQGNFGQDTLYGNAGDDSMDGGVDDDLLYGGDGADTLEGDLGNDYLSGGADADLMDGGAGNDDFDGGDGNDTIIGGAGNDSADGDGDDDSMSGGAGNDSLWGDAGNDTLDGGAEDDALYGGTGDDSVDGGAGTDYIQLTAGADTVSGGDDDDNLDVIAGGFADGTILTVDGGAGGVDSDTLNLGSWEAYRNLSQTADADGNSTSGSVEVQDVSGNWITVNFTEIENLNLPGGLPNFIVEGDAGDDLINAVYADDPEGDMIDAGDHSDGSDADSVVAGGGNDTVFSGAGNDTVQGGTGADELNGGGGDDILDGGSENDSIFGGEGNDTMLGGAGDDSMEAWLGDDSMVGGDGNDYMDGAQDNDTLEGGAGNDTLLGGSAAGDDSLDGGAGDDSLTSGDGDDTLVGGIGDDSIFGGGGDDIIVMEDNFGNDTIHGWTGTETNGDTLDLSAVTSDLTVDLTANNPEDGSVTDGTSTATFQEIENIVLGGGRDTILLDDGAGNNSVEAFDLTDSGDGTTNDQLDVSGLTSDGGTTPVSTDDVTVTDTNGDGTGDAILTFPGGESITLVGVTPDQVDTPAELQSIGIPGPGPNFIVEGTGGNDQIDSAYAGDPEGDMVDNLDHSDGSNADSIQAGAGDDTVISGAGNDTVDAGTGDDLVFAGAGDDTVMGMEGADTLNGVAGDDLIDGGADNDSLVSEDGAGNDTIIGGETGLDQDELASFRTGDVVVDLTAGGTAADNESGTLVDGADTVTFSEIEEITLGAGNDSVIGSDGNDSVATGDGADTVDGGAGDDSFDLGPADGVEDVVVFSDGDGDDTVTNFETPTDNGDGTFSGLDQLDVSDLTDDNGAPVNTGDVTVTDTNGDGTGDAILTFPNGETITLTGVLPSAVDDPAALEAMGIPAPDYIVSGTGGNDTIDAGYLDDPEGDLVDAGDALDGSDDDVIQAVAGDDSVLAGAGDDEVFGGDGSDTLLGGVGNDTLDGDDGFATGAADSLVGGAGNDQLIGDVGDDTLEGGTGNDTIFAGDDDDLIDGGTGDDQIFAQDGDDTITVGDAFGNDTIVGGEAGETDGDLLDASGAIDDLTLDLSAGTAGDPESGTLSDGTDTLGFSEIENIELGSGNDTLTGSTGDDDVALNEGDDVADGGSGNDTIDGGEGADTLTGGEGDDFLTTGPDTDRDVLVFGDGSGNDVVSGFDLTDSGDGTTIDQVDVSGMTDAGGSPVNVADVVVTDTNGDGTGDAILTFPNGESITLAGITPDQVDSPAELNAIGIPCFTPGTMIATLLGQVAVEDLKPGDLVLTADNGFKPVQWVGSKTISGAELQAHPELKPVILRKGAFGNERKMAVSPQHGMIIKHAGQERLIRAKHAAEMLGGQYARIDKHCEEVTYIHIMFDQHELVFAEGTKSESFFPGPMALRSLDKDAARELLMLFPELAMVAARSRNTASVYGAPVRPYLKRKELNGPDDGNFLRDAEPA